MFIYRVQAFGKYKQHVIEHSHSGNLLAFIPEKGATITDAKFRLHNKLWSVIDGYTSAEELRHFEFYKNALLFPFANRINNGTYEWKGNTYHFPINETERNNALHGFATQYGFEVTSVDLASDSAVVYMNWNYEGDQTAYPFPLRVDLSYEITADNGITARIKVANQHSEVIPVALGWHPYFRLGGRLNYWELKLPKCQQVSTDDRMLPEGETVPFAGFFRRKRIGDLTFDDCFKVTAKGDPAEVHLQHPTAEVRLRYWQRKSKNGFQYFQLFTPPLRQSIAIEPMTGNINAFNNGEGLVSLAPQASTEWVYGFQLQSIRS